MIDPSVGTAVPTGAITCRRPDGAGRAEEAEEALVRSTGGGARRRSAGPRASLAGVRDASEGGLRRRGAGDPEESGSIYDVAEARRARGLRPLALPPLVVAVLMVMPYSHTSGARQRPASPGAGGSWWLLVAPGGASGRPCLGGSWPCFGCSQATVVSRAAHGNSGGCRAVPGGLLARRPCSGGGAHVVPSLRSSTTWVFAAHSPWRCSSSHCPGLRAWPSFPNGKEVGQDVRLVAIGVTDTAEVLVAIRPPSLRVLSPRPLHCLDLLDKLCLRHVGVDGNDRSRQG